MPADTQTGSGRGPVTAWEVAAKRLLRAEMSKRGWRYQRLALELKLKLGIVESTAQLTRKVNRGKFGAGFLLACIEVLGISDVRMSEVRRLAETAGANDTDIAKASLPDRR
jgi:hypothetical protein